MDENEARPRPKKTENERGARLKAALKANLARRKAQAKARNAVGKTGKVES